MSTWRSRRSSLSIGVREFDASSENETPRRAADVAHRGAKLVDHRGDVHTRGAEHEAAAVEGAEVGDVLHDGAHLARARQHFEHQRALLAVERTVGAGEEQLDGAVDRR